MTHSTNLRLKIAYNVSVLCGLFFLDIRDLVYKTQWIGPFNNYAFSVTSLDGIHRKPMQLAQARETTVSSQIKDNESLFTTAYQSGFASFLDVCDNMTAVSSDPAFVLQFVGQNCRFGPPKPTDPSRQYRAKSLFLDTSMRVDAVTWGSCQLLFPKRRPEVCHTSMVLYFLKRYNLEMPAIQYNWMARPNSAAEEELMAMLDVVDLSWPMHLVVCGAGFEFDFTGEPVGKYVLKLFGCASPNQNAAAIVGHFAPQISELIGNLQWLTADDLNLLGYHFVVRENCHAFAQITQSDPNDRTTLQLSHTEIVNFSSYGTLYHLMLLIDVTLLMVHVLTAIEMLTNLILPLLSTQASRTELDVFQNEDYANFFSRSLGRSPPIIAITLITELLSWMTILPASTIWTWSHSRYAKLQSFLTTMRLWTLLLLFLNAVWDVFVNVNERIAYEIARRTYLTPFEIVVAGIVTCFQHRASVFGIGDAKYGIEKQRVIEFGTLLNADTGGAMVVFANSFNEELDHLICTSLEVVWKIYAPLLVVIVQSVVLLLAYAMVKMVLFHQFFFRPYSKHATHVIMETKVQPANVSSINSSTGLPPKRIALHGSGALQSRQPTMASLAQTPGPRKSMTLQMLGVIPGYRMNDSVIAPRALLVNHQYERLPLENLLETPIRARSLVRDSLDMEIVVDNKLHLPPSLYFDFGVFVCNGLVKTRRGFVGVVEAEIKVRRYNKDRSSDRYVSTNVLLS